ncbi:hypothetical protein ACTNEN_09150 [Oribacterium sp. HCP28S3_H8]|uniref:hypothetical protein n=1 Tax=Oribacterium sp. HCP28S3_H8 TaxID=3438945 RepID=UPI003F89B2BA
MMMNTEERVMITDPAGDICLHSLSDPAVERIVMGDDVILINLNERLVLICGNEDVARVGGEVFLFGRALISRLDDDDIPVGVTDYDIDDMVLEMTRRLTTARIGEFCIPVVHLKSIEEVSDGTGRC